ncbi:MAG: hypothetical protein KBC48_00990 [Candidatus Pacebacteria bacterium]|nr:hypothetical protein [Candidatus Paceibacterota bacterium]
MADVKSRVMLRIDSTTKKCPNFREEIAILKKQVDIVHVKLDLLISPSWSLRQLALEKMEYKFFFDIHLNDVGNTVNKALAALKETKAWGFSVTSFLSHRDCQNLIADKSEIKLFVAQSAASFGSNFGRHTDLPIDGVICAGSELAAARQACNKLVITEASLHDTGDLFPATLIGRGADFVSIDMEEFRTSPSGSFKEAAALNGAIEEALECRV